MTHPISEKKLDVAALLADFDKYDGGKSNASWHPLFKHARTIAAEHIALTKKVDELEALLRRIEPHIDSIVCFASTIGEHEPNRIAADLRTALNDTTQCRESDNGA